MAAFTYPGVYIEELSSGQHTITGVATSIGAFIGWAAMGPVDQATLVQSWSDFQTTFGGLDSRSWLGYAVNQFFANGGSECYIVRLAWDGTIPGGLNNPVACATAVANGVGYGLASVSAAYEGATGSISLGIGASVLESVRVLPTNLTPTTAPSTLSLPPLPIGSTLTLQAYGTNSDGSVAVPAGVITWASSNPSIASVSGGGVVTAVGVVPPGTPGGNTVTITATSNMVTGSFAVSVTSAKLNSITVSPATVTTNAGETVQLAAAANYSDGTTPDITSVAVWVSSSAAATFASSAKQPLNPGELAGVASGSSSVTAALASTAWSAAMALTSAAVAVTVNAPAITSAAIAPGNATVPLDTGGSLTTVPAFTVAPVYSSSTGATPGTASGWASSDETVATIDSGGHVTLVNAGTTTITALYTPTSGTGSPMNLSTSMTVKTAALESISVTPQTLSLAAGLTQQLTATGVFNDGTSVDMTGYATWTSATPADVTVSPSGLVTGVTAGGPINVQAEFLALTPSDCAVTVKAPVVESIAITTGGGTSITPGTNFSLIATATYSNGTTGVITNSATWTTSTPLLASIVNPGVVSALVAGGSLTLFASSPGAWANNLRVSISTVPNNRFNLLVQQVGTSGQLLTLESYVNLSVSSTDPSYVVTVINTDSNYLTFTDPLTSLNVVPTATPVSTAAPVAFTGGADGTALQPNDGNFELALAQSDVRGYQLLDRVDIFNLLCIPGESTPSTISNLQEYCMTKRAFYIVDSPQYATISGLITNGPVGSSPGSITGVNANYSAFYFPWVQAPDPLVGNRPALFPPCGFVAGIFAATDASRGVWKAPAGIAASLTGNSGLQYVITEDENGSLNPQAVNCIRQFKVYGDVVWGARTLDGNDQQGSQWKYVPIRRLALYIESSLYDGTQWVVFEPNDETLWGQVRLNVGTFMQGLFLEGAFAGTTPQQAYFVKCDGENNPASSVAQGIVNILVGFAPVYPAEFVVIQIQQIVAQSA
jgi:phage tail sheath protein FI